MYDRWTLPLLQNELDDLQPGMLIRLERADVTNLFGLNSAAVGRVCNFAQGHNCEVILGSRGVMFRKSNRYKEALEDLL